MNGYTPTPDFYRDYIAHFNPFHDPKNGQFASNNGSKYPLSQKQKQKIAKDYKKSSSKAISKVDTNKNYIKAYNSQTKWMNDKLSELNSKYEGKEVDQKYEKEFNKLSEEFNQRVTDYWNYYNAQDFKRSKYYRKGEQLIQQYGAENISDLAVDNEKLMNDIFVKFEKKYKGVQ